MNSVPPVHRVRLGHIEAAVWRTELPSGARYSVTFGRLYHVGGNWKSYPARILGHDELQCVAEVAVMAGDWIARQGGGASFPATPATVIDVQSRTCYAEE